MSASGDREPKAPLRPSLPHLVWFAVAAWVGVIVAEAVTWRAWCLDRTAVSAGGWVLLAAAYLGLLVLGRRWGAVTLVLTGILMGLVIGAMYWTHWHCVVDDLAAAHVTTWRVEILGDASEGQFGASVPARVLGEVGAGMRVRLNLPRDVVAPEMGRRVEVLGTSKPPGTDERARRSHRLGEGGSLTARRVRDEGWARGLRGMVGPLRLWAVRRVAQVPGTGGDLLAGVVLGDRRRLAGTPAETDFRTTGLTHLVAVSGSHLVVVAAVVAWLLSAAGAGVITRRSIIGGIVGAYVVFSGVQASAVRAWFMAIAASAAWLSGRRADGGASLGVAVVCVLVSNPANAFDLGFQLSVAAVAGLVVFARLIGSWLGAALPRRLEWLAEPMALTLAATAVTVPLTVSTFGMFSLVAPLANLIVGPLVDLALMIGLLGLASSAAVAPLGALVLRAAGTLGALATSIAGWLAGLPYAAVPLGFSALTAAVVCVAALAAVWAVWPRPTVVRARAAVTALVLVWALVGFGPPPVSGPSITVLDIGQGDAVLVRDGAHAILVDTGPSPGALRAALGRAGVRRLDAVVITHLHADHYGGLEALEGLVQVDAVYFAAGACDKPSAAQSIAKTLVGDDGVGELEAGETLSVGDIALSVLWPEVPVEDGAQNESSVVLEAKAPGFSALLTGDAEAVVLDQIAGEGGLDDIDVLKVGHHGSADAVSDVTMAALKPEWAFISVGTGNKFGHPRASTLRELSERGARIVRTDLSGDITLTAGRSGCTVRTRVRN